MKLASLSNKNGTALVEAVKSNSIQALNEAMNNIQLAMSQLSELEAIDGRAANRNKMWLKLLSKWHDLESIRDTISDYQ